MFINLIAQANINVTEARYEYSNPLLNNMCCCRSYEDNVLEPMRRMCNDKASCVFNVNDSAFNDQEFSMTPDCFKRKLIVTYTCTNTDIEKASIVPSGRLVVLDCLDENGRLIRVESSGSYLYQALSYILPGFVAGLIAKFALA